MVEIHTYEKAINFLVFMKAKYEEDIKKHKTEIKNLEGIIALYDINMESYVEEIMELAKNE